MAATAPEPLAPERAAPAPHAPGRLRRQDRETRETVVGERKQVTVLFSDIKGSLELLGERDPEDAQRLLDAVVTRMMEAVRRYDGTVSSVMGDGIMAIFGAPLAHEDHAIRACYAALAMQSAIRADAPALEQTLGVTPQVRTGLNSGEVVVRTIGDDLHMDYSAIGLTTHLAARMEQTAVPGTIQLTAQTMRLVEGLVEVRPLGRIQVKGMAEPVETFQLLSASPRQRPRPPRDVITPFVARDEELARMGAAAAKARAGRGQIVSVSGDPGVGKSRLFQEFLRSSAVDGFRVVESMSVSYGKASSYFPVIHLLKSFFGLPSRDEPAQVRARVTGRGAGLGPELVPVLPALLSLLDVPSDDREWANLDPSQRRRRTLDGLITLFVVASRERPLVLVLEDLQWIDTETQAFLDRLRGAVPTSSLLLLVNHRPEYHSSLGRRADVTDISIDSLDEPAAHALLDLLLGPAPQLAPTKRFLIQHTGGNPLFLEESIRMLVETGVLVGAPGTYRQELPLTEVAVPPTVHALLAARIDRLPPLEKDVLRAAAVIGREVPHPVLARVLDGPEEALREALIRLQAMGLLQEARLFPDLEYEFRHSLMLQVAYRSLLRPQRTALHARALRAMEEAYAGSHGEHVERLAHHAFRGEAWPEALSYLRQAADKDAARSAHHQAIAFLEQALLVLRRLPRTRTATEQAIDIRFDLRNALFSIGEHRQIFTHLQDAAALAGPLKDTRRLGWVSAYMSHYYWRLGAGTDTTQAAQRAIMIGEKIGDLGLQTTHLILGLAGFTAGEYVAAAGHFQRVVDVLTGDAERERFGWGAFPAVAARAYLAGCLSELGRFSEGEQLARDAIRLARDLEHPFSLGRALAALGLLAVEWGRLDVATSVLEEGLRLCETWEMAALEATFATGLGHALTRAGRAAEGLPLLERGTQRSQAHTIVPRQSRWLTWLAESYLAAGRLDDAREVATTALEISRRGNERGNEAHIVRLIGMIEVREGTGSSGEDHYRDAARRASTLGMRPLEARCRAELAAHLARVGRAEQAREELAAALGLLDALGMPESARVSANGLDEQR